MKLQLIDSIYFKLKNEQFYMYSYIAATVICLVLCLTPLAQPAKTVNNYIFIKLTYAYIAHTNY